ncbi:PREDICTED: angiopoietin-4-like, partial [Tinamus guttatus]|uniref:angiopoietin-4-like n=1 Tax=Tinamus guttatus TaxID=94827 RepID=UPI00052EAD64
LESYIQASVRPEMAQLQRAAVHNQTATMLEIGSSLLNRTAEQTRKLTDVEAQVLNQTSRIELQLLETSLSTSKLEKQLLLQTNEIHKLQNRNNVLELRVLEMESKQQAELAGMHSDKEQLQRLLSRQRAQLLAQGHPHAHPAREFLARRAAPRWRRAPAAPAAVLEPREGEAAPVGSGILVPHPLDMSREHPTSWERHLQEGGQAGAEGPDPALLG